MHARVAIFVFACVAPSAAQSIATDACSAEAIGKKTACAIGTVGLSDGCNAMGMGCCWGQDTTTTQPYCGVPMNCTLNNAPLFFSCSQDCSAATMAKKGACAAGTLLTKTGCNAIPGCCWGTDESTAIGYCGYAANCTAFRFKCSGSTLTNSLVLVTGIAVTVLIAVL